MIRFSKKKRNIIIASFILLGTTAVGGTVYALAQHNAHQANIEFATKQIELEQQTLDSILTQLEGYNLDDGYLAKDLTAEKLDEVEKSLNMVKDSYIDFHIEKDDLKNEIKVIKLDKKSIQQKIVGLNDKVQLQQKVNDLFGKDILAGSEVSEQAVTDNLTKEFVENLRDEEIDKIKEVSKWKDTLLTSADNAIYQLDQIKLAEKEVAGFYKNDKVASGVSRDAYDKAKTEVNKIKNKSIKSDLKDRLSEVLKVVEADELKAKEESEEKARQEAEARAQAESEAQALEQSSSNGGSGNTSNYSNNSGSESSSYNSGTNSSYSGSSGSTSNSTSASTSNGSSASTSSSKPRSSQSSGSSSSSSNSKPNNSSGGSSVSNTNKVGEGDIKDHGGDGESGRYYEEFEFEVPADWYN